MLVGRPAAAAASWLGTGVEDLDVLRELLAEEAACEVCVSMKRAVCARSCLRFFQFCACCWSRPDCAVDRPSEEDGPGADDGAGRFLADISSQR